MACCKSVNVFLLCTCYAVLSEHDTIWSHRKLCVTLLANPIRSLCERLYILLYGTVCERAKVVTTQSDGYQGWLCTAAVCNSLHVHLRVVHTLACWHAATPCAIVGAGPGDSVVPTDHHVAWLAHECHILAHCDVITDSKSICWDTRISTGDHCQRWARIKTLHQTSSEMVLLNIISVRKGVMNCRIAQCFLKTEDKNVVRHNILCILK